MGITFNAFEIFEMAEQVERNGAKFYRAAAKILKNPDSAKTMLELAEMEEIHEQTFANMRKSLSEEQRELMAFDPEDQTSLYLQAMAGGHVFNLRQDLAGRLTGKESVADILQIALGAEKDSIIFYLGLKDFVPPPAGRDRVDGIIKEEMRHITILNQLLTEQQ